jgi:hypothetical protein
MFLKTGVLSAACTPAARPKTSLPTLSVSFYLLDSAAVAMTTQFKWRKRERERERDRVRNFILWLVTATVAFWGKMTCGSGSGE